MQPILVTGFEPFAGARVNPSALAVQALSGRHIRGREILASVLPCVFGDSLLALERMIVQAQPALVICVGQASGRESIAVERVALNVNDASIPDNGGAQPRDTSIDPEGPVAYWSTLPIKNIAQALQEQGIAASVSESAGTFVCNHVFYGLMRLLRETPGVLGGFIHVPELPEQGPVLERPSMPLEQIVRGIEIAIDVSLASVS